MNSVNPTDDIKSILIIAPAWIGDMVMAQTLFKVIKYKNPAVNIDVLAPGWTLPLVERMPEVRTGILFPLGHGELKLLKRYAFGKKLRKNHYDQAIVLPGSFKSALTALWAKIPRRTGWVGEWRFGVLNDIRRLRESTLPLMIQQFAALALRRQESLMQLDEFYPKLLINEQTRQATLAVLNIKTDQPILALCPGAEYGPAKRWPIHYFALVANEMLSRGWQVFIFGSKKDNELAANLMMATDQRCIDLTGKTSLLEAVDLLSLASAVITNDSGLMHIASALNRPMIVVYGSSSPSFTPPLSNKVTIMNLALECSPCFKRSCPLGHFNCMNKISADSVLFELNSLIKS